MIPAPHVLPSRRSPFTHGDQLNVPDVKKRGPSAPMAASLRELTPPFSRYSISRYSIDLTMPSAIFLASPSSIMVLSR